VFLLVSSEPHTFKENIFFVPQTQVDDSPNNCTCGTCCLTVLMTREIVNDCSVDSGCLRLHNINFWTVTLLVEKRRKRKSKRKVRKIESEQKERKEKKVT
jgi:hypothetical protein